MKDDANDNDRNQGFVLVAVIWLAATIAAMATGFAVKVRIDTLTASNLVHNTQVETIADGLANLTAWRLAAATWKGPTNGASSICQWRKGITADIRVQDQAGLIDLNTLPPDFFQELFARLGASDVQAKSFADAMLDYKDVDALGQDGSAEPTTYPERNFGPKNGPYQSIEELDQLPGMTDKIYRAALPFLTVYSAQPGIDPLTVPAPFRKLFDQPPTGDFTGFLSRYFGAAQGKTYGLDIRVKTDSGARFRRKAITVILQQPDKPFVFLEWQRGGAWQKDDTENTASKPCIN